MGEPETGERRQGRASPSVNASLSERMLAASRGNNLEALRILVQNPELTDQDLLRLLERKDLPADTIRAIANHQNARGNYNVQLALARHAKTPRAVSLPILKFLYLFDLLRVAQTPAAPSEVKAVAEEAILKKLPAIPRGEKVALARRGTARITAALLMVSDQQVVEAALDNPYLSESHVLKILSRQDVPPLVVTQVAEHPRWSRSYNLRLTLIRNPHTPFGRILSFLPALGVPDLRDICLDPRLPEPIRLYLQAHCRARTGKPT